MRSKTLLSMLALAGTGALLLSGCSGSSDGGSAPAADEGASSGELVKVSVGVIPVAEFQTVYIADEQGFFEEAGLDVSIEVQANAASIVPSVLNGQLTFGTAATPPFLVAVEQDLPLRAIANAGNTADSLEEDTGAIIVAGDSDIQTLKDLDGKTIATNALNSLPHVAGAAQLAANGVDIDKVEFVAMPFPDMQGALEQGRVDALLSVEPFMTSALSNGARAIAPMYAGVYPSGTTHTLFFTSAEYQEKNPEVVVKFQEAIAKANDLVTEDNSYLRDVLVEHGQMDPAVAAEVNLPIYDTKFNIEGIEAMAKLMVDTGFLSKQPDVSAYFVQ